MAIDKILVEKREDILRIAAKHGVAVFGFLVLQPVVIAGRKAIWTFLWR